MKYWSIIIWVYAFICAVTSQFSIDTIIDISLGVAEKYFSTCIYLLHSAHQDGLRGHMNIVEVRKAFTKLSGAVTFQEIYNQIQNIKCRPLYTILSNEDISEQFCKYLTTCEFLSEVNETTAPYENNTTTTILPNGIWLIFMNSNVSLEEFFEDIYIPFDSEILVAQSSAGRTEENVDISLTEVYHIHPSRSLQVYRVANWSADGSYTWPVTSLHQRRGNLHGIKIRAAFVKEAPFIVPIKNNGSSSTEYNGFMIHIWDEFTFRMNFSHDIVVTRDGGYGTLENGTWNGEVGIVNTTEVDIGLNNIIYTVQRMDAVNYLPPVMNIKFSIYIKSPGLEESSTNQILQPFSSGLWKAILINVIVLMAFLSATWNINLTNETRPSQEPTRIYWLCVFGSFCQQAHYITPETFSCRLVYITLYFTAGILFSAYSATFISFLSVRIYELPFMDFQGVLDDGTYRIGAVSKSATKDYFQKSEDSLLRNVYQKLMAAHGEQFPTSYEEGLRRVCTGYKYGLVAAKLNIKAFSRTGHCTIIEVPGTYYKTTTSMIISKTSPFRKLFSYNIQHMRRTGLLQRFENIVWPSEPIEAVSQLPPGITIETVYVFFMFLFTGILLSVLILVLEILFHNKRSQYRVSN